MLLKSKSKIRVWIVGAAEWTVSYWQMLWAEEKVFSLYKTFQQTAKSSSACLKSLEKSDLKVSSCGVVMMGREKEGCFFPWWTVQKDLKGAFLRGQKMLHANQKVSSNSRKAVIKAGTFLPQSGGPLCSLAEKGAQLWMSFGGLECWILQSTAYVPACECKGKGLFWTQR